LVHKKYFVIDLEQSPNHSCLKFRCKRLKGKIGFNRLGFANHCPIVKPHGKTGCRVIWVEKHWSRPVVGNFVDLRDSTLLIF
jgi:hypothetical protein